MIKVDIQSYFDTIDHRQLRRILDQRVRDGVMRRTIDKWLNAGVLEDGGITQTETGVPQGVGVAPLLSNLFLHDVLDTWVEQVVKPRLAGDAGLYRFADDAVILCACEDEAQRVMAVLPKRFEKYGLRLHPEKTRVIRFTRPPRHAQGRRRDHNTWPGTFDLLGFAHYWGRSRQGNRVIKRKTASARLSRALKRINTWCREHRHTKVWWQHQQLMQKLRGHYGYYGITGNVRGLRLFHRGVERRWRKWLSRRSQRAQMSWQRLTCLLERYPLPQAKIVHTMLKT